MNKVVLVGRLTKDPELKFTPGNGNAVATFSIAVDRRFKKDGQPSADFVPIVVWGKTAENTATYMSKGKQIAISGRLQTRHYENKEGNRVYVTEIVAEEVTFLGGKKSDEEIDITNDFLNKVTPIDEDDSDIPF